jgi:hypothetical protein
MPADPEGNDPSQEHYRSTRPIHFTSSGGSSHHTHRYIDIPMLSCNAFEAIDDEISTSNYIGTQKY